MDFDPDQLELAAKGNPRLRKAIVEFNHHPTDKNRRVMYEAFIKGPIFLGVRNIPEELGSPQLDDGLDVQIEILTSDSDEGPPVILAFSDMEALHSRCPDTPFIIVEPVKLLQWVIEEGYDGIVLNPAGPWAGIHRDEVEVLLGVDGNKGPAGGLLSESLDPPAAIYRALERLLGRVNDDAFVVFRDAENGALIRFNGSSRRPLSLWIPVKGLKSANIRRLQDIFAGFLKKGWTLYSFPLKASGRKGWDPDFFEIRFDRDADLAAKTALEILDRGYRLKGRFHLLVEER